MKAEWVLVVTVGICLEMFQVSSFPRAGTSGSMIQQPRIGIRSSNGISDTAQYATHRPYKADFDLLRVSERSQELAMPLILSNDISGDSADRDAAMIQILTSDPTLRSRRKRQIPLSHQIFFGLNPDFSNNPAALNNHNSAAGQARPSALAVPSSSSAFFIPASSLSHHPAALGITPAGNRNELAILANYYQPQQLPPQNTPLQLGIFQGPLPVERQRPELDGIHTKYPYPYPPTLDLNPQSPVVPESGAVGGPADENQVTTDYPVEGQASGGTTLIPGQNEQQEIIQDPSPGSIPDSPAHAQQQPPQELITESAHTTEASGTAPTASVSLPVSDSIYPQQNELAMQKRLREMEEEVRQLRSQLEQANLQVVSYEQENSIVKDQFQRSEEANLKLRDRVLQLENSNQHLQDQNGQLQQQANDQRQQINALKVTQKEAKDQLAQYQEQMQPLSEEIQKHRKEIEGFLIRIRKLGEESETCKKQVKLYQLKINYIQDQQNKNANANNKDKSKEKEKEKDKVLVQYQDDELDPELSRMDAEIAALQKNADEVAAALNDLPQPNPEVTGAIPESAVPAQVSEQKIVPPQGVEVKKESEFPGEAVQIPQRAQQPEQPKQQKTVVTAEDVGRGPAWEEPAGF